VRRHRATGTSTEEVLASQCEPEQQPGDRLLQVPLVRGGRRVDSGLDLEAAREHCRRARVGIPWSGLKLSRGEPAIPTTFVASPVADLVGEEAR
jgi:nicotinate phosphoribosyltransferase